MKRHILLRWKKRMCCACMSVFFLTEAFALPAYADSGWRQDGGLWYYYDAGGVRQTGWFRDPETGLWFDLDSVTGVWIRKPVIDEVSAVYLLENAIKKADYYQDEEDPVEIVVTWQDRWRVCASIRLITGPNNYSNLNNYVINKKTGTAEGIYNTNLNLYD